MNLKTTGRAIIASSLLIAGSLLITDCTSKITQEQLQQLQELKRKESSISDQISQYSSEIGKLREELKQLQAKAKECEENKAFVEDKLKSWPDVWPDWTPNQENK